MSDQSTSGTASTATPHLFANTLASSLSKINANWTTTHGPRHLRLTSCCPTLARKALTSVLKDCGGWPRSGDPAPIQKWSDFVEKHDPNERLDWRDFRALEIVSDPGSKEESFYGSLKNALLIAACSKGNVTIAELAEEVNSTKRGITVDDVARSWGGSHRAIADLSARHDEIELALTRAFGPIDSTDFAEYKKWKEEHNKIDLGQNPTLDSCRKALETDTKFLKAIEHDLRCMGESTTSYAPLPYALNTEAEMFQRVSHNNLRMEEYELDLGIISGDLGRHARGAQESLTQG